MRRRMISVLSWEGERDIESGLVVDISENWTRRVIYCTFAFLSFYGEGWICAWAARRRGSLCNGGNSRVREMSRWGIYYVFFCAETRGERVLV